MTRIVSPPVDASLRLSRPWLWVALCAVLLSGCGAMQRKTAAEAEASAAAGPAVERAMLAANIAGEWRDPKNSARDAYRHPEETLSFFGLRSDQNVVEITPGGAGWYTEILAPYLRAEGHYVAALVDPAMLPEGRGRDYQQKTMDDFKARLAKHPEPLCCVHILAFDPKQPKFSAVDGGIDTLLTFRNVHNWVAAGTAETYFRAFYAALRPGGVLGVVDHRAKPGADLEKMKKSGYLTEALVIELATKAGFTLDARSEINANPKDDTDHPNGVWTLPPTNRHDPEDGAMYQAVGESDRMTLRFVKPAQN